MLCVRLAIIIVMSQATVLVAQQLTQTLTQPQACKQFSDAVVRIEAGGESRGTGFIVSPDGFVLTASHVVRGEDGKYFSFITVSLPTGTESASIAAPMTADNVGQDFAVLKVANKTKPDLPFLQLGSTEDVVVGADATIIGYPFSASTLQDRQVSTKFCLSASFVARDLITVPMIYSKNTPQAGTVPGQKDVKVDVIYFQSPSLKGISGSPIISRDTGRVVGIVTRKLTGIGTALMTLKQQTGMGMGSGIAVSGLEPGKAVNQIVTVMDDQLSNDLGAATGIDDPKFALKQVQRKKY